MTFFKNRPATSIFLLDRRICVSAFASLILDQPIKAVFQQHLHHGVDRAPQQQTRWENAPMVVPPSEWLRIRALSRQNNQTESARVFNPVHRGRKSICSAGNDIRRERCRSKPGCVRQSHRVELIGLFEFQPVIERRTLLGMDLDHLKEPDGSIMKKGA